MSSAFLKTIVQSAMLKSAASLTAQLIGQYRDTTPQPIDWSRILEFAVFGLIQAQIGCWWQQFLEDILPSRTRTSTTTSQPAATNGTAKTANGNGHAKRQEKQKPAEEDAINWKNVALKLIIDQTIGQIIMNTTFLVCTNTVRLRNASLVYEAWKDKVLKLTRAAWKLWPWVAICNFIWVPVEKRVLVASCVGFGWNVFLAFYTMPK